MKCPQCGGELKYPDYAWGNVYQYRKPCTVRTESCGKAVQLILRMEIGAFKALDVDEDDWGNAINE